jgi:hypothetical protein
MMQIFGADPNHSLQIMLNNNPRYDENSEFLSCLFNIPAALNNLNY